MIIIFEKKNWKLDRVKLAYNCSLYSILLKLKPLKHSFELLWTAWNFTAPISKEFERNEKRQKSGWGEVNLEK